MKRGFPRTPFPNINFNLHLKLILLLTLKAGIRETPPKLHNERHTLISSSE